MKQFARFLIPACMTGLAFQPVGLMAQLLINQNVSIAITAGTEVTVKGDCLNKAGTTINNDGTIAISGDWINNSGSNCFGLSSGTVTLNGAAQSIGGNDITGFYNLTAEGSGMKTLLVNASVGGNGALPAGILSMNNGVLDLNSHTLFVTNPLGGAIVSVNGSIRSEKTDNSSRVDWNMQNVTGDHTIPFSNNAGASVPFTYNLAGNDHGHVVVSTYAANGLNLPLPVSPNAVTGLTTLGNGDPNFMAHRYWQVNVENPGNPSELTFTFDLATENCSGSGALLAQRWDNVSVWQPPLPTQNPLSPNSIHLFNNSQYGAFGLARGASPLPISLLRFTAQLNANKEVDLQWITETEVNNDFFSVERSGNGLNFETILERDGAGNSTTTLYYQETDKNPLRGISYYRLRQTDFDGTYSYSGIVPVRINGHKDDIRVYPNPVTDYILVSLDESDKNAEEVVFELYDGMSRMVLRGKMNSFTPLAENTFKIERGDLAEGTYFYRITKEGETVSEGKMGIVLGR